MFLESAMIISIYRGSRIGDRYDIKSDFTGDARRH